jgi:hypothetical protein
VKYLKLSIIFSLFLPLMLTVSVTAQINSASEYELIYHLPHQSSLTERQLIITDIEGSDRLFSEHIVAISSGFPLHKSVRTDQMFLSPDRLHISSSNQSGDLLIFDLRGRVIAEYNFDSKSGDSWANWYVWGWQSNNTIVVSASHDDIVTFYKLNLSNNSLVLDEFSLLNDFFHSDPTALGQWQSTSLCYCDVIQFSPDFSYALMPKLSEVIFPSLPMSAVVFVNFVTNSYEVMPTNLVPWWFGEAFPAWSSSNEFIAYSNFQDSGYQIYSHHYDRLSEMITSTECYFYDNCRLDNLFWSPTNEQILYVETMREPSLTVLSSELRVVDILSKKQSHLFSISHDSPIPYWSPDSTYIAFVIYNEEDNDSHSILTVISSQTGEIVLSKEIIGDTGVIGWVDSLLQ